MAVLGVHGQQLYSQLHSSIQQLDSQLDSPPKTGWLATLAIAC